MLGKLTSVDFDVLIDATVTSFGGGGIIRPNTQWSIAISALTSFESLC